MKYESTSDKPNSSNKKLLSWDELLEKGALLKDTYFEQVKSDNHFSFVLLSLYLS